MKVTIIMACYNAEAYIDKAIASILEQSIGQDNLEVIMVNDQSKDRTYEIATEYARKYKNFSVYSTEFTSGSCATPRNVGLRYAKNPYILFLDPDDYLDKDACKVMSEKIEEYDADIVKAACQINGKVERYLEKEKLFDDLETIIRIPIIHTCAHMYKLDIIKDNNITFPDGLIYEDQVFFHNYILNVKRLISIPEVVHYYEQRSAGEEISVTKKTDFRSMNDLCTAFSMVRELVEARDEKLFRLIAPTIIMDLFFKIMVTDELTTEQEQTVSRKLDWLEGYVDKDDLKLSFCVDLIQKGEVNLFRKYFKLLNIIADQIANPDVKTVERKAEEYIRSGDLSSKKLLKLILEKRKR